MTRLLLLVLAFPILEILLLVQLAHRIGTLDVLLYLVLTALLGGRMIARPGWLGTIGGRYRLGTRSPLTNRMLEIAAGVLLILPGILSDLLALVLVVPAPRAWLLRWVANSLPTEARSSRASWSASNPSRIDSDEPIDVNSKPAR